MTPESYKQDPYIEAANQLGHMTVGAIASLFLCCGFFAVFGEMPYRWHVWLVVGLAYAGIVEYAIQGWAGRDSLADLFFVQLGVTMVLMPVKEVDVVKGMSVLEFKPQLLAVLLLISLTCLLLHIRPIVVAYFNEVSRDG